MGEKVLFWHRRDLRVEDNAGLYRALKSEFEVQPLFIFDKDILEDLPKNDARVGFIYEQIAKLKEQYVQAGGDLWVFMGKPLEVFKKLLGDKSIKGIYTNRDYEPYAKQRDKQVANLIESKGGFFAEYKDHLIFEYNEVLKDDGKPYTVYTPYSKKWKAKIKDFYLQSYPSEKSLGKLAKNEKPQELVSLFEIGFEKSALTIPTLEIEDELVLKYNQQRDIPSINGTSRLGIHFRFGTVSIRKMVRRYISFNSKWVDELIWRDFYAQILANFPHVAKQSFKPEYDQIEWRNNEEEFEKWKAGKTGVGIVDAGMRELAETGFMHNRVRMIVASYLCKNLLIDWRWGEAWFAEKLLDFDLASNNGGWQWASGSGVDAAPYFRIFNPILQTQKFDPDLLYIKKWVPEHNSAAYANSIIVDHAFARQRCLDTYKAALKGGVPKPSINLTLF